MNDLYVIRVNIYYSPITDDVCNHNGTDDLKITRVTEWRIKTMQTPITEAASPAIIDNGYIIIIIIVVVDITLCERWPKEFGASVCI